MIRTSRVLHCLLLAIATTILVWGSLYAASNPGTDLKRKTGVRVQSLRDLRFQGMIEQSTPFSCGAASLATLVSLCSGADVSEQQALEEVKASVRVRSGESVEAAPITALDLQVAAGPLGLDLRGYRVTIEALCDFLQQGGLPVIAHGTRPHPHFVVVLGIVGDEIVLADPSWGRSVLPPDVFAEEKGFSGVILVPVPTNDQVETARGAQAAVLLEAEARRSTLRDLWVALP